MKHIVIVGGGIAGIETAAVLISLGFQVTIVEKESTIGGHLNNWHQVFPDYENASNILKYIIEKSNKNIRKQIKTDIVAIEKHNNKFRLKSATNWFIDADVVVLATGFDIFDTRKKEEYGYGIYDNVITSADLENLFKCKDSSLYNKNNQAQKYGFVHCVGSRDEKIGNMYCSKVCCITAIKQAIELKKIKPESEIFCFYMDLRMFDRFFEDIYKEAQEQYNIQFIRGRLSEATEDIDKKIIIKVEDTLLNKPLKVSVDMLILMSGMVAPKQTIEFQKQLKMKTNADKFLLPKDNRFNKNISEVEGVFFAGTATGPKSITDTISDARSAAYAVANYLNN